MNLRRWRGIVAKPIAARVTALIASNEVLRMFQPSARSEFGQGTALVDPV